jgi:hypothetical protein
MSDREYVMTLVAFFAVLFFGLSCGYTVGHGEGFRQGMSISAPEGGPQ